MAEDADREVDVYEDPPQGTVRFHYIKSSFFRVIHVDGAYGGITARGFIHAAIYNERRAIPQITEARELPDGKMSKEVPLKTRKHVTRELEADLIMTAASAREFAEWLMKKADSLAQMQEKSKE